MSEYEWETRRVPKPPKVELFANYRPHHRAVAEFAALEHPREHVGWILKQHSRSKSAPPVSGPTRKAVPNRNTEAPTAVGSE